MTYGCYNRPPLVSLLNVQDGWVETMDSIAPNIVVRREPSMTPIQHLMSRDCQYTHDVLGRTDPGCVGCKHRAP